MDNFSHKIIGAFYNFIFINYVITLFIYSSQKQMF